MLPFQSVGKTLIILGILIIAIGVIFYIAPRFPIFEKIPGNFLWRKGPVTVYFPLGICLLVSIILTLLFSLWGKR
ncbi:hypothetical protein CEE37_06310 [candidate division LCP-89 bacterium B3_LCP]|uniref:DUF2905 domain-containing protein n=1 Tax=candidate division LCP-89 bacterium B3_LCP TaxID=2012998 RepID=A0A532V239_UNCL8|nr:MAG: hypothetical protein CEE37_06310 [candidate division LCP-89 bacterium B3_LCP]